MTADLLPRLQSALGSQYAVERELGRGGMATVYLARDIRHDRPVALKVLHPELAAVIGAERFLAEIRVTANLQHPHILPLFDSGHAEELLYYVMPFVAGESLRALLARETQLPVEDAVRIAREVASALDYAHRHGVVHRDIKPENILLHDGTALVADFGIALAVTKAGGNRLTQTGLSLGTPHYMSPEQAMGDREIDGRSDVYALASTLYEMLVGEPPFTGPSSQAVIAKLLTEPPPAVTAARRATPTYVAAALHRAMQKLPADRFASAADFRTALGESLSTPTTVSAASANHDRPSQWTRAVIPLMAFVVLGIVAVAGWRRPSERTAAHVVRFELVAPDSDGTPLVMAVSPNGSRILMVERAEGRIRLFARELGSLASSPLQPSDRGPGWPFFSPDGTEYGFTSVSTSNELIGTLRLASVAGGPARTVADSVLARAGWGDDGFLYYAAKSGTGQSVLVRIPSRGGEPDTLVRSDSISFFMPHPLPGSRGLLMITQGQDGATRLALLDLHTRKWQILLQSGFFVAYDPSGYVLFDRESSLMAVPFDASRLAFTGPAVPVLEVEAGAFGAFDMGGGTLTYLGAALSGGDNDVLLVDRKGSRRRLQNLPTGHFYSAPAVSPNGRRIALGAEPAVGRNVNAADIWIYEVPAGPLTRLTFGGRNDDPTWTPDGSRILFHSDRGVTNALWVTPSDGGGEAEKVLDRGKDLWRTSWLPDGRRFLFDEQLVTGSSDIGIATIGQPDSTRLLLDGRFDESWPAASPDGRWLAYQSAESGREEIYVRPLGWSGARRQVSRTGGRMPVWSRNGRAIFFVSSPRDSLAIARLDLSRDAEVLGVTALFPLRRATLGYDVFPGDSLFIVVEPKIVDRGRGAVVVVSNFAAELRARMASTGKAP